MRLNEVYLATPQDQKLDLRVKVIKIYSIVGSLRVPPRVNNNNSQQTKFQN